MPSPNWSQRALAGIFSPNWTSTDLTLPLPGMLTGPAQPVVIPAGTGFGVAIQPAVWVLAGAAPATTGSVLWAPPGYVGVNLAAANPTNPRHDLITLQVTDPGTSSTSGSSDAVVVQGTPASSPTDPAVPTGALVIARVNVRAGTSSIVQSDITNFPLQTGLRRDQPSSGWIVTGIAGTGTWSIANNSESRYPGLTIVEAQDTSIVANPASATIQVPGSYLVSFSGIYISGGSAGLRKLSIKVARGGSDIAHISDNDNTNQYAWLHATDQIRLLAGDVLTPVALQLTGGTLSTNDADLNFRFTGRRLCA